MSSVVLRTQQIILISIRALGAFADEDTEAPFKSDLLKIIENE